MKKPKGVCSVCGRNFTPIRRAHVVNHPNLFGGVDRICAECWKRSMKEGEKK